MGEYAPDDQRDVHTAESAQWREAEDDQQARQSQSISRNSMDGPDSSNQQAQMGYGNARDVDGQMEQASVDDDANRALPDDNARPDMRARSDAARPLGES